MLTVTAAGTRALGDLLERLEGVRVCSIGLDEVDAAPPVVTVIAAGTDEFYTIVDALCLSFDGIKQNRDSFMFCAYGSMGGLDVACYCIFPEVPAAGSGAGEGGDR